MFKNFFINKNLPFWLLSFSFIIALTLPVLIQDGMFLDAMLYTSVSHNLSQGIGTFWFPQFSTTYHNAGLSSFHEHPPLVFAIQSLFFKLLGDSMYVERLYTFLTTCITAFLINLLWRDIFRQNKEVKQLGWLPVFMWITIPVAFWSYSNNMQENTMGIFTLYSVWFIFKAVESDKKRILNLLLSGLFIFFATMSKGLPGFFPVAVPFLYWLITKKDSFRQTIGNTLLIIIIPVVAYFILFSIPESRESLSFYLFKRVFSRINDLPTVGNRFFILNRLLMELLPQIILTSIIILTTGIRRTKELISENLSVSLFFISIGLAGSLPLMLTLVQKGFYFVPSLPFFAIGLSVIIAPRVAGLVSKLKPQTNRFYIILSISALLFSGSVAYSFIQMGKTSRDRDMLSDIYSIGKVVPKFSEVTVPSEIFSEYVLGCYFIRYFNISLNPEEKEQYYMIRKTMNTDSLSGYKKVDIETKIYDLYRLK